VVLGTLCSAGSLMLERRSGKPSEGPLEALWGYQNGVYCVFRLGLKR